MAACTMTERLRSWSMPSCEEAKPSTTLLTNVRRRICGSSGSGFGSLADLGCDGTLEFRQELVILGDFGEAQSMRL